MQNFPLYLKKTGLASRNIVHLQKNILRCVGFCLYVQNFKAMSTIYRFLKPFRPVFPSLFQDNKGAIDPWGGVLVAGLEGGTLGWSAGRWGGVQVAGVE